MYKILLLEAADSDFLCHALHSELYQIRKIQDAQSLNAHVREYEPDLVVLSLGETAATLLDTITPILMANPLPVIVYAESLNALQIKCLMQAEVSLINIGIPATACAFEAQINIAFEHFQHLETLKKALEEARTQLEDRKQIDRAKAILIKTRSFSEDEAYHTLRKLAMGRNITLGEMARNVIAMADLLK